MRKYTVERNTAVCSRPEFVKKCVDIPKFLGFCRECPNYGNIWMCPPFDFDPAIIWDMYDKIKLVGVKLAFVPSKDSDAPKPTQEEASDMVKAEKAKMMEELWAEEERVPGSLSFFAGSCALCESCARRRGEPCIHPDKARRSIEAIGADVGKAAKEYLGWELKWGAKGRLPEYYVLVSALFMK